MLIYYIISIILIFHYLNNPSLVCLLHNFIKLTWRYIFSKHFSWNISSITQPRPTLKNCLFPITCIAKKKSIKRPVKRFFTLFKLNITFYFKCYLHHDCSVNLNWNNTQLYSSAKLLRNVPSSVFWFVNFCFLPFLHRTSVQKWKKTWFCYVHKWIG